MKNGLHKFQLLLIYLREEIYICSLWYKQVAYQMLLSANCLVISRVLIKLNCYFFFQIAQWMTDRYSNQN
jgi:hypothetical protein